MLDEWGSKISHNSNKGTEPPFYDSLGYSVVIACQVIQAVASILGDEGGGGGPLIKSDLPNVMQDPQVIAHRKQ